MELAVAEMQEAMREMRREREEERRANRVHAAELKDALVGLRRQLDEKSEYLEEVEELSRALLNEQIKLRLELLSNCEQFSSASAMVELSQTQTSQAQTQTHKRPEHVQQAQKSQQQRSNSQWQGRGQVKEAADALDRKSGGGGSGGSKTLVQSIPQRPSLIRVQSVGARGAVSTNTIRDTADPAMGTIDNAAPSSVESVSTAVAAPSGDESAGTAAAAAPGFLHRNAYLRAASSPSRSLRPDGAVAAVPLVMAVAASAEDADGTAGEDVGADAGAGRRLSWTYFESCAWGRKQD